MGPLEGTKVLEMEGMGPGPFCGMMLADMGADVLVISRTHESRERSRLDILNRNKATLELDLKTEAGRDTFLELVQAASMVIDPFRPGVTERLGIGPEPCLQRNPRLVYGRITGWGQTGPLSGAAGRDLNYIALTGALDCIGTPDKPVIPLNLLGDHGAGLYLLSGLLAAHVHALQSGEGQVVEASICESVASMMTAIYGYWQEGRWTPERRSNFIDGGAPYYNVYKCADGKFVTIAAIDRKAFDELIERLGLAHENLPDQHDAARRLELQERLAAVFATKTRAQWCEILENTETCFAPVLGLSEAPQHPQMVGRGVFTKEDDVLQPAPTPRFGKTPSKIRRDAAAEADKILSAWGLSPERITARRQ